ncbi:MAG TPA: FCD domain-containing protein [Mycobacteriales bacterium]|nr:FCD domain-containing protein [Mycobacteriales bacterium]
MAVALATSIHDVPLDGSRLARAIRRKAEQAGLHPGDRLPPERALADDLQVSRAAIRAALGQLEADGAVSRQHGRGTFIRALPGAAPSGQDAETTGSGDLTNIGPADVMAVRCVLEPQAMTLVVAKATARDLARIQRYLAGGDTAETFHDFEKWDLGLHRAIMEASHNPLLLSLYDSVESARHGQLWGDLKRRSDSPERRERYRCEHHAVVAALHARDSERATEAMRQHLTHVQTNLLGVGR